MNELKKVVDAVLEQQKLQLAPSTYDVRKNYLKPLVDHGDSLGISEPCQELYDSYVSKAITPDLRFQLFHAVRLVDKEAGRRHLHRKESSIMNRKSLLSVKQKRGFKVFLFRLLTVGSMQFF